MNRSRNPDIVDIKREINRSRNPDIVDIKRE
jgi:hypothetical protein